MRRNTVVFDPRRDEAAWPRPQFIQFPEFEQPPAPANPVVPFRVGQWLGQATEPLVGVAPQFIQFSEFEQPPLPANPVIAIRYGQDVLQRAEVQLGVSQFLPFPYFEFALGANPIILFIQNRQDAQVRIIEPIALAQFLAFPWGGIQGEPPPTDLLKLYREGLRRRYK